MWDVLYAEVLGTFFQYGFTTYVLATVTLAVIVNLLFRWRKFQRSFDWIPGPPALPLIGNAHSLAVAQDDLFWVMQSYGEKYGRVFRLWVGVKPFVVLSRAADIQPILTSIQYINKSFEYSYLKDWLGEGLIVTSGSKWHKRRKMLTPTFHRDMLADSTDTIAAQIATLLDHLDEYAKSGTVFNILPELKHCTLDIICVTAMGVEAGAQKQLNQLYLKAVEKIITVVQERFFSPWLQPEFIFQRSTQGKAQAVAVTIVNDFVNNVIEEKRREKHTRHLDDGGNHQRKAFLDLLLDANDKGGAEYTAQDLRDEVNTFMFAGHESTACALGWALFLLGKHPDAQEKIVEEAKREAKKGDTLHKQLQSLHYLDMCLKEVMRLYPIAPIIGREIQQPVKLSDGKIIPPGCTAIINLPSLHRDPKYFPRPAYFDPERFSPSNTANRHPFAYIPFSAGPRNCIGQRFAQMTTKHILLKILQRFSVTSVDLEQELNLNVKFVLINKKGIRVSLKPRESQRTL